jgi:AraC-like DNA-binding protein
MMFVDAVRRHAERVPADSAGWLAGLRDRSVGRALSLLLETHATVAAIALDVGYESEAAFARAFKRQVGTPPAAWRRGAMLLRAT